MPATRFDFEIYRGLTWAGLQLIAVDAAGSPVAQGEGTTYLLQARKARGQELAFAMPVVRGTNADGQIIVPEMAASSTALLPVGKFQYDLIPISADGKPWPPIMLGIITVFESISKPS